MLNDEKRELVNRMLEFDPEDVYHSNDCCKDPRHSYYNAIDRCILLITGEITSWTDSKVPSQFTHKRNV